LGIAFSSIGFYSLIYRSKKELEQEIELQVQDRVQESTNNWREFEMIVASVFEEQGFDVELTQATAQGFDIKASKDQNEYFIECKFRESLINSSVVNDIIGRAQGFEGTIVLATKSALTKNAEKRIKEFRDKGNDFVVLLGKDKVQIAEEIGEKIL
jgi:HJR/Mrr/RecB family endonuclease